MPFVHVGVKPGNLHQGFTAKAIDAAQCWT